MMPRRSSIFWPRFLTKRIFPSAVIARTKSAAIDRYFGHYWYGAGQSSPEKLTGLEDKFRIVYAFRAVLAQQFDKPCNAPPLVRAEVIVNVPSQVILAKIVVVFGP